MPLFEYLIIHEIRTDLSLGSATGDVNITLGKLKVYDATESTDKDTGAVVVEGGVGIEKRLNVGGAVTLTDTTSSTSTTTGALKVSGGIGCAGQVTAAQVFSSSGGGSFTTSTASGYGVRAVASNASFTGNGALIAATRAANPAFNFIDAKSGWNGTTGTSQFTVKGDGAVTSTGQIKTTDPTNSTAPDNGSITTMGGVGIEKNLNVGGTITCTNLVCEDTLTIPSTGVSNLKCDTISALNPAPLSPIEVMSRINLMQLVQCGTDLLVGGTCTAPYMSTSAIGGFGPDGPKPTLDFTTSGGGFVPQLVIGPATADVVPANDLSVRLGTSVRRWGEVHAGVLNAESFTCSSIGAKPGNWLGFNAAGSTATMYYGNNALWAGNGQTNLGSSSNRWNEQWAKWLDVSNKITAGEIQVGGNVDANSFISNNISSRPGGLLSLYSNNLSQGLTLGNNRVWSGDNQTDLGGPSNRWAAVYAANGVIQTSAEELKDHTPLSADVEQLLKLKTVEYTWKEEKNCDDIVEKCGKRRKRKHHGFIAGNVAELFPDIVHGEGENMGFNYAELLPLVVKTMQEMYREIKELKEELEVVKGSCCCCCTTDAVVEEQAVETIPEEVPRKKRKYTRKAQKESAVISDGSA